METLFVALYGFLDGLREHHGKLFFVAVLVLDNSYGGPYVVGARPDYGLDLPAAPFKGERDHDPVLEEPFGDAAYHVSGGDGIPCLDAGRELPAAVRDGIQIDASFEEESALFRKLRKRVLKPVEDLGEKSGPELYAHEGSGELDLVADLDAVGHLVDLRAGDAVVDTYDFALKARAGRQYVGHFVFSDGAFEPDCCQVAVDSCHVSFCDIHE